MTDAEEHMAAAAIRARTLRRMTEINNVCSCKYPLVTLRNGHGHGTMLSGAPCPAIAIIEIHQQEDRLAAAALRR